MYGVLKKMGFLSKKKQIREGVIAEIYQELEILKAKVEALVTNMNSLRGLINRKLNGNKESYIKDDGLNNLRGISSHGNII